MKFLNKHEKIIIRFVGVIGVLFSIYTIVAGGMCLWSYYATKNNEGFFYPWSIQISKNSNAIVLNINDIDFDGGISIDDLSPVNVQVSNNGLSNQMFVGIAMEEDIELYLNSVEHDEITALRIFPGRAYYQNHSANVAPEKPTSQTFWVASTSDAGIQSLTWRNKEGSYYLVIMNQDGSADIDVHFVLGTKVYLLILAGIVNLMVGLTFLMLSLMAISLTGKSINVVYPKPLELMIQDKKRRKIVDIEANIKELCAWSIHDLDNCTNDEKRGAYNYLDLKV